MNKELSDISKATLKNKKVNRNRYIFAPLPEEIDNWDIAEAKGCGVPHAIYYDTLNKLSIFPSDIPGFEERFTTDHFAWRHSGWLNAPIHTISEAEDILKELQKYFNGRGIKAYLLYVYGSEKGNVSVAINDNYGEHDDMVLWVYTTNDNLADL